MQRRKADGSAGTGGTGPPPPNFGSSSVPTHASSYLKDKPRSALRPPHPSSPTSQSRRGGGGVLKYIGIFFVVIVVLMTFGATRSTKKPGANVPSGGVIEALKTYEQKVERTAGELLSDAENYVAGRQSKSRRGEGEKGGGGFPENAKTDDMGIAAGDDGGGGGGVKQLSIDATAAMLRQPSNWVDGEKKLKKKLKELVELQKQGKYLGAKILTRWLGDDIPVWVSDDVNETEWQAEVDRRYAKMRERETWERSHHDEVREEALEEEKKAAEEEKKKKRAEEEKRKADAGKEDKKKGEVGKEKDKKDGKDKDEKEQVTATNKRVLFSAEDPIPRDAEKRNQNRKLTDDVTSKDEEENPAVPDKYITDAQLIEFPLPSEKAGPNAEVLLEPTFGIHRPNVDAVFAFAEGYDLEIYLTLIESLKEAGFSGDIVLSISSLDTLKNGVEEYLRAQENVVVYTVRWTCYNAENQLAQGTKEGQRMCTMKGMYGLPHAEEEDASSPPEPVEDPRVPRPVATSRYELYWAWSLRYNPHRWIMLIDSRDVLFQGDPFLAVEREKDVENVHDGVLYFFGENNEATSLGKSKFNRVWLQVAYPSWPITTWANYTTICSGSTMGEQIAIETYLRAMVAEFDETQCKRKGCDQGFHNYLFYTRKLDNAASLKKVVLYEQGTGIINNLGALREKPLRERGLLSDGDVYTKRVLNWDKSVSPVAHQFDRDEEMNYAVKHRKKQWLTEWLEKKA